MAKQPKTDVAYDSMKALLTEPDEELEASEKEELVKEELGLPDQPGEEPVEAKPEEPTSPPAVAEAEDKPSVDDSKPKATDDDNHPVNKRIRQLVDERKAAEKERDELRERFARVDERTRLIREQEEARQAAANELREQQRRLQERPDDSIDPQGAAIWDLKEQNRRMEAALALQQQQLEARLNQTVVEQDTRQFTNTFTADVKAAQAKHADYLEAARFATEKRMELWTRAGYTPEQAYDFVNREAAAIASQAYATGNSATDVYYEYAKQMGWGNGGGAKAPQAIAPKEKLQQIAAGTKATGFGATPNVQDSDDVNLATMTASDLGRMSDETFSAYANHPDPKIRNAFHKRVQLIELGE